MAGFLLQANHMFIMPREWLRMLTQVARAKTNVHIHFYMYIFEFCKVDAGMRVEVEELEILLQVDWQPAYPAPSAEWSREGSPDHWLGGWDE